MKFFTFIAAILLFASCQENDDLVYQVNGVEFTATKLQSTDGSPFTIEDSISGSHFGFRIHWDAESNNEPYDPVETTVRVLNPVTEFKIWSNQTVSGRSPGSSLNTLFNIFYREKMEEKPLEADGGLDYLTNSNDNFSQVESSFLKAKTIIAPGSYDFYIRSKLSNGTVLVDTIPDVKIK
jgi:hypothetical protein